jgi:pyrroloquinoline-quinone synthase
VSTPLSPDALEAELRRIGEERYHDKHPFHQLLHGGALTFGQVQAWALNRYCYQAAIPRKDAALVSRLHDRALRRAWTGRIRDHDGDEATNGKGEPGGIERWLVLTDGLGLDRAYVTSMSGVLPAMRFAVEAYVHFVSERTPLEAIASSLTELFAPAVHRQRIAGMLAHYDFIGEEVMAYFRRRLTQAPRDVAFALDYVRREANTAERQRAVIDALHFKCDVLWAQLDALHHAYVTPALPPPGAFVPGARRERVTGETVP